MHSVIRAVLVFACSRTTYECQIGIRFKARLAGDGKVYLYTSTELWLETLREGTHKDTLRRAHALQLEEAHKLEEPHKPQDP